LFTNNTSVSNAPKKKSNYEVDKVLTISFLVKKTNKGEYQLVFIIWVGTHKAYDKIDVTKIEYNG